MLSPHVVLFDLDGTVSDSAPGILAALRHAFDVNGLPRLNAAAERSLLGPPFHESLPPLIGGPERLAEVIAAYREQYAQSGMYDTRLFPGVADLLRSLRSAGIRLAVATSKPEAFAGPVVEHLGLAGIFETVGGDTLDGARGTKALVIDEVLSRLGRPYPARTVMVGDRSHDVLGGQAHGLTTIAVTWGYAMPGELAAARPDHVCDSTDEIAELLGIGADAAAS